MRIGVVSDSHGNLYMLDKAISQMGSLDLLIHLGDHLQDAVKVNRKYGLELHAVGGNNDYVSPENGERLLELAGRRLLMTHGHRYGVSLGLMQLEYRAKELGADIVLFGHTHRYFVENNLPHGIFYLNPGSVSRPRDAKSSAALLEIDESGEISVRKILVEDWV